MKVLSKRYTLPAAKKVNHTFNEHGVQRIDPYFWMRLTDDQKKSENPDEQTRDAFDYLNAENDYLDFYFKDLKGFEEQLFEEIKGRIKQDDTSVPYEKNGYYYQTQYEEGKEYPVYVRFKEHLDAAEEVLIDVNQNAAGHAYYKIGDYDISMDNKIIAYSEDTLSRRIYTIRFKNLKTGEYYKDELTNTEGNIVWANDNKTIFYIKKDPLTLRAFQIWKHVLGEDQSEDELVYEESDDTFYSSVYKTKSDNYIVILSLQTLTTEAHYIDANSPTDKPKLITQRGADKEEFRYFVSDFKGEWFIKTNWNAPNWRVMKTKIGNDSREHWEEVIPHDEERFIESFELFNDYLVMNERKEGILEVRVLPWEQFDQGHLIQFPEKAHLAGMTSNYSLDNKIVRVHYQSMKTPPTIYDYDMESRTLTLLKEKEVLGGFDKKNYIAERQWATARDGKKVPMSIVYHKDTKIDGTAPLLQYAYGSYGNSMDPYYRSTRLSLLDRGFVYVIAHIRGGQELGKQWYLDGKLLNKKNTFYDFIDCSQWLIDNGYSHPEKLYAMGGSAGGLLMGAIMNMQPELYGGIIAAVPFVDVISTMLDESIPLTTFEFDEWGNPKQKEYFDYMLEYSPYDQVESKAYPPTLVTTGLFDSQVQYWEPAKWVAKLRDMKTDNHPLLLKCDMETGHGGASGRFKRLRETAMEYTFLIDLAKADDTHRAANNN